MRRSSAPRRRPLPSAAASALTRRAPRRRLRRRPRRASPDGGPGELTDKPSGVKYAPHRRDTAGSRVGRAVRRARERSAVHGYKAAAAAMARIPVRVSLPVGRALFVGSYYAWPAKRRIILSNASHVLGLPPSDRRVRHLARRVYATYARFVLELMRLPGLPKDEPT